MKKLSTYLFLIFFSFQTSSLADDIRDFQIEGMSVGDSLLDYFTEEEIQKNILTGYKDNTFAGSSFIPKVDGLYEAIQVHFKTDDEKYIIFSLDGMIAQEQIKKCIKQRNKIVDEMSKLFKSSKKKLEIIGIWFLVTANFIALRLILIRAIIQRLFVTIIMTNIEMKRELSII